MCKLWSDYEHCRLTKVRDQLSIRDHRTKHQLGDLALCPGDASNLAAEGIDVVLASIVRPTERWNSLGMLSESARIDFDLPAQTRSRIGWYPPRASLLVHFTVDFDGREILPVFRIIHNERVGRCEKRVNRLGIRFEPFYNLLLSLILTAVKHNFGLLHRQRTVLP